jgi:hypothetical protein
MRSGRPETHAGDIKTKAEPKSVISRLAPDLVARLDAFAARQKISRNAAVERLIAEGLDRAEAEPPPAKAKAKGKRSAKPLALPPIPAPRPRPERIVGFDPITGAPIHGR